VEGYGGRIVLVPLEAGRSTSGLIEQIATRRSDALDRPGH
jgi:hypothetical protein